MSVWKRVLVKTVILVLVILLFGGGAVGWQAYRQSTPEYAIDQYVSLLIDNGSERAYALLDQSEDAAMSFEAYTEALAEKKYSLHSGYTIDSSEKRRDQNGKEYVDYRIEWKDAEGNAQGEETFTVKKQPVALFGVFDQWKVLSGHCMIRDFVLTVPTGAEVYLDGQKADAAWLVRDGVLPSYDCYQIPSLLPGKISLTIRHSVFESVGGTLDPLDGSADYGAKMTVKQSAEAACEELGIEALKQLYSGAAKEKAEDPEELFAGCTDTAKAFVEEQGKAFHKDDRIFKSTGITDFAVQFEEPVFTGEATGAITLKMKLSYRYLVRESPIADMQSDADNQDDGEVTQESSEASQEGNEVQETETQVKTGDNTATFVLSWHHDAWHIVSMEVPVIPE